MRGVYCLIGKLASDVEIKVGSLGKIGFKEGYYAYVGSAMINLEKRVERHFKKEKRVKWHIDYLVMDPHFSPMTAIYRETESKKEEHELAGLIDGEPVPYFGSSDCSCFSHLFYMGRSLERARIEVESAFIELGGEHKYLERVDSVIFDLDNTLVNYNEARDLALSALARKYVEDPEAFLRTYNSSKQARYKKYPDSPQRYRKRPVFADVIRRMRINISPSQLEEEYWALVLSHLRPNEGAKEVLRWLKNLGIRVYIFSDGIRRWQEAKLSSTSLIDMINARLYSEDLGLNKVNPRSYEIMLSLFKLRKEDAIFVGDCYDTDVRVPLKIGLRSVLLTKENPPQKPIGAPIIASLVELKGILRFVL